MIQPEILMLVATLANVTGGNYTSRSKRDEAMEKLANRFESLQQSMSISCAAAVAASLMKEAEVIERRLGQSEGYPLCPQLRARMQARLNKIYDELYGPAQDE
ncbi:hypothetical protein IV203_025671 [Nitzschia inconspicua]|uniref:Uncharacterized protein n=1 Tax=Nitzschia inconspicua TaxID=303405 RepID=A0A9K3PWC8_9STRA|nr:hypothetical protein IV203_025671 [Nitzschia inconspicua]